MPDRFRILTLNQIASEGLDRFPEARAAQPGATVEANGAAGDARTAQDLGDAVRADGAERSAARRHAVLLPLQHAPRRCAAAGSQHDHGSARGCDRTDPPFLRLARVESAAVHQPEQVEPGVGGIWLPQG